MNDVKQIRSRLWNSLEMQVVIKNLVVVLILAVFCILLGLHKLRYLDVATRIGGTVLIMAICTLPMLIFCLVRTFRIFWKPRGYHFCKTKLSSPKGGEFRHTIKFTVLLEDSEGKKFVADTHSIFYTHGLVGPLMEDYVNQTVTIAHNEETGMLVIIG